MAFTPLETERLIIRKWEEHDRDVFHRLNSDEEIMRYFPFRRNREESDALMDRINNLINVNGFSFGALELKSTGGCIGFCGIHKVSGMPPVREGSIEIGWRLLPEFQGNGYVTEAGFRLLDYGFNTLNLKEIVSFAVHKNASSIAVMERLGMKPDPARDFDLAGAPKAFEHLKRHRFYKLTKAEFEKQQAK